MKLWSPSAPSSITVRLILLLLKILLLGRLSALWVPIHQQSVFGPIWCSMDPWTRSQWWPHLWIRFEFLQLVQGLGRAWLLLNEQDWVLAGHLGAASSAMIWWPHSQDQQLIQRDHDLERVEGCCEYIIKRKPKKIQSHCSVGRRAQNRPLQSRLIALCPHAFHVAELSSAVWICEVLSTGEEGWIRSMQTIWKYVCHAVRRNISKRDLAWCHFKVALCHHRKTG